MGIERLSRFCCVAALLLSGLSCARPQDATAPAAADTPPNIVIFLVDTLRADRLGTYGYSRRPTSPHLDRFAEEAVIFEQAYSPSPWTLPSVASMASGAPPCEHGVHTDRQRLPAALPTLAEALADRGYLTMGLYGNAYAGPSFGLDRGYEHYTFSRKNDASKVAPLLDLATADGRPFLLYIHNMEPHGGERFHGPPQPGFIPDVGRERRDELLEHFTHYRRLTRVDFARKQPLGTTDNTAEQQRELAYLTAHLDENDVLYDAAVRLADERFGSVLDLLRDRGLWDDTVVVFLSDHGDELAEHGGWQHDQSVYEELVRVPLVIRFADGAHGGGRVRSVVSLLDLPATLLAVAGVASEDSQVPGHDLARLIEGAGADDLGGPAIPAMRHNQKKFFAPWKASRGDFNLAVREGQLKAIVNVEIDTVELYDLVTDPGESEDLVAERPDDAARLRDSALQWLSQHGDAGEAAAAELDPETRERLRAMGYVD